MIVPKMSVTLLSFYELYKAEIITPVKVREQCVELLDTF